jgi:hypothetical protein
MAPVFNSIIDFQQYYRFEFHLVFIWATSRVVSTIQMINRRIQIDKQRTRITFMSISSKRPRRQVALKLIN